MPILFLTKVLKIYDGEKTASSTNVGESYPSAKTETRTMFITLY
jgi:hypothetical protein